MSDSEEKNITVNRKARHEYAILQTLEPELYFRVLK